MNEKSRELKCTLAACIEPATDRGYEKLPRHCTIAPPFVVSEEKYPDLVADLYNIVSNWSELACGDDKTMAFKLESNKIVYGTDDRPVMVRRIDPECGEALSDLLGLRKMVRDSIENTCGDDATDNWHFGELHVADTGKESDDSKLDLITNSLVLFVKRDDKWHSNDAFYWND